MTSLAAPAESNFYQWFNSSKFVTALGHVQSRTYHSTPSESTLSDHPAVFVPLGDLINDAGYGTRSADATDMCQQANVAFYVNNRTNAFTFYATRNISSGEQVDDHCLLMTSGHFDVLLACRLCLTIQIVCTHHAVLSLLVITGSFPMDAMHE